MTGLLFSLMVGIYCRFIPFMDIVSALNFALLFFLDILSCIAISLDPSRFFRDACPTLHPPLRFIPHDPHDPNDSYDLCLKINQSSGGMRDESSGSRGIGMARVAL